jgi:hypothetical protein
MPMVPLKLSKKEYDKVFAENNEGNTVHAFMSYSSTEEAMAGSAKDFLEKYGLSVFLAREDIKPTADWQKEIVYNLKSCDVFMPLLTAKFSKSEWTDQETGMAFALDKFIIPLKVDVNPYGFIWKYQGCPFDTKNIKDSCLKIIQVLRNESSLSESLRDCLLRSLEKAHNFDAANEILKELAVFKIFTGKQINQILRISIKNNQVRMCKEGQNLLETLLETYSSEIDPVLKGIYEKIKDSFSSPVQDL